MQVELCDICGKPIDYSNPDSYDNYKLKKEYSNWYETSWLRLIVHCDCYKAMCEYIRNASKEVESKSRTMEVTE